MVLVSQSNGSEDSQSRQLRVSKKLSKAISSVPRSRFQKPRPNLPGSKRTETNASSSVRKTNEISQNTDSKEVENSSLNEPFQKGDTLKDAEIVNKDNISTNSESIKKSENSSTHEIYQNDNTSNLSEDFISNAKSENVDILKYSATSNIQEKSCVDKLKKSLTTEERTLCDLAEISENSISHIDETSQSDDTVNSESTNNETLQDLSVEKASAEGPHSIDIQPVAAAISIDKSSKYPHLTSILSKKRAEPKKEVQHKKRKKYKKGDAAPERSKMTMADLIYWNPTNSDPPSKSSVTEYEIPNTSNVDEPEESPDADTPAEENNICDSVPKLVISEDGSINIDQSSLVVSRSIAEPTITEVIRKDDTTYSSFRKRPMTKHWTPKDTTIFYKALSLVGTDFGLMEKIFPHRTRRELKLKFKREEKFNIDLINRAMYESHLTFDANTLGDLIKNLNDLTGDFSSENGQEDAPSSNKEKKKCSNRKRKSTTAVKDVDLDISDDVAESVSNDVTATNDDKERSKRRKKVKKLPEGFIDADEIDDIILLEEVSEKTSDTDAVCELNSKEIASDGKLSNVKISSPYKASVKSSKDLCKTTNIEILCINNDGSPVDLNASLDKNKAIFVPDNTSDVSEVITIEDSNSENTSQTVSFIRDSEQEQCITLEYVDVNEGDLTLLNNVMAFEVVASNTPIPKRRRKTNFAPKLPQKVAPKKSCQALKLSSTNYTPV